MRDGKILDPEKLFFDERLDCGGAILAPGFIDVQINGKVCVPMAKYTLNLSYVHRTETIVY